MVTDEVCEGDQLVAMGTATTLAHSSAEEVAVWTLLLPQVAGPAGRAFVDCLRAGHTARGWQLLIGSGVAMSPSGLTAGVRAVAAPALGVEGTATDRADRPGYRYAIVT